MAAYSTRFLARWTLAGALGGAMGVAGAVAEIPAVVAGLWAGVCLGGFQWRVLRGPLPLLPPGRWVGATVWPMAVAWGATAALWARHRESSWSGSGAPGELLAYVLALGLTAGWLLGYGQWRVLRNYVSECRGWRLANALGGALALLWVGMGLEFARQGQDPSGAVSVFVGAACLAGASVGAVTGKALVQRLPVVW